MTTLYIAIALLIFAFVVGVWWYVFFGQANPPLPRINVSIGDTSSSSLPSAAASSSNSTSSFGAIDAGAADNSGENSPLATEPLSIDGITFSVEIASTMVEQARGLSFRPSLGANDGMLFTFATGSVQTFWMKDMNFPLDMIWISGNTVTGFTTNIPAPAPGTPLWELVIYPSPPNVDKVLEVNAGTVVQHNIRVGDAVKIGPVE